MVLIRLGGEPKEYPKGSTQKLLSILFSENISADKKKQQIEDEFGIPMSRKTEGEVTEMCNLSLGIWEKGVNQGIEQGISQGEGKLTKLFKVLMKEGRYNDLNRVLEDEDFRQKLYKEYNIE